MLVHAATNWPPMNQATHHRTNHNYLPMERTKSFHYQVSAVEKDELNRSNMIIIIFKNIRNKIQMMISLKYNAKITVFNLYTSLIRVILLYQIILLATSYYIHIKNM